MQPAPPRPAARYRDRVIRRLRLPTLALIVALLAAVAGPTSGFARDGATTTGGTASANPSAFTGRELDPTGLYYYRARYYEPGTGRFLSEDPAGFAAGDPNLYRYLGNDPQNGTDPSGLCGDCVIDLAFIGADLYTIATGSRKERDAAWASLGLDVLGLFVPLAFGLGHLDEVVRLADDAGAYLVGHGFKASNQVTPGIRRLRGEYINDIGHGITRVEPWEAHYDEFGRVIARTDFNAGNKAAGIPDVHHINFSWGPGCTPCVVANHIPGPYRP